MSRVDGLPPIVRSAVRGIGSSGRRVRCLIRRADAASRRRAASRTSGGRRLRLVVLAAVAVVLLAGVTVLSVLVERADEVDLARSVGLDQARQRTEQILSYSPQTADADIGRAREGVTGAFADQFGNLLSQLVQPSLASGLTTHTKVTDASVISAEPGQMTALLFLEQTATAPGQQPRVQPSRARVTMTSVAGQWLISDLQSR